MTDYREPTIAWYGGDRGARGVLSEHLQFIDPARLRIPGHGRPVVVDSVGQAWPVLCSEVVVIDTEDGRVDGRCGGRVTRTDDFACPGHQEDMDRWYEERERAESV